MTSTALNQPSNDPGETLKQVNHQVKKEKHSITGSINHSCPLISDHLDRKTAP